LPLGFAGDLLEGVLVDAVVVELDRQVLEDLDERVLVLGMIKLAAGRLGHRAHGDLVNLARSAKA